MLIELPPKTDNMLNDCLEWQKILYRAPNLAARDQMAKVACEELCDRTFLDAASIVARSEASFVISTAERHTEAGGSTALQFGAVRLIGVQGKTSYLVMANGEGIITWPIYDAEVLDAKDFTLGEDVDPSDLDAGLFMPVDRPSRMPIHLPVSMIDYALPIGR